MGISVCADNIDSKQERKFNPKQHYRINSELLHALYCDCEEILDSEYIERDASKNSFPNAQAMSVSNELAPLTSGSLGGVLGEVEHVVTKAERLASTLQTAAHKQIWQIVEKNILTLEQCFKFEDHGHVDVTKDTATYYINFFINEETLNLTKFFVRWGCYDDVAENWEDLEVRHHEIIKIKEGHFYIKKVFPLLRRGWYGATCYAQDIRSAKQIWQGIGYHHDAKFRIDCDSERLCKYMLSARSEYLRQVSESLLTKIKDYQHFVEGLEEYSKGDNGKYLSEVLYTATNHNETLRNFISAHFKTAQDKVSSLIEGSEEYLKSKFVYQTLNNIGVGEVVLVSPEGPQATFGGIAQVIEGWLKAFPEHGIPVTLISLLYEQAQGNKHGDAFATLRNGINICGKNTKLKYCGEVDIPFGPTTRPNGGQWVQGAYNVRANVYMAECGNVRVFLLRHARYADRLYPHLMGDEHLRRVIFLGRGALEIMKNPAFGIRPQLIISNDWISALVPVLHKLDWRYNGAENLKKCKTIHLVHNAGKDYQGRFANNHNNQNLYSMLELDHAHWDGLMDPRQKNMFNITSAALLHLNGAIVAVSRTYAKELLTKEGADGLEGLMWKQKDGLFGISNGIDQVKQRKTVLRVGEGARQDLGWGRTCPEHDEDLSSFFDKLLGYKAAAKLRLQRNFGLHQGEDKVILTLVGRLAEQKGISLLMGNAAGDGCSVLELILRKYPETQFVIAGPRVDGDNLSERFCGLLAHLSRCFSGRVLGITEFVPHDFAMEIFTAGDWTLMPSRFEPCGLSQLHALLAGSLVIARNVGGLSATLERFDDAHGQGNGFMFDEYSSTALRNTMCWALDRTRDVNFRKQLMLAAAKAQHDWSHRIPQYVSVFQHILGVLGGDSYLHLQHHRDIISNQVGV